MTEQNAADEDRPVHLLFTCTANRVRSPFAAAVARSHIDRLGLPVAVRSAGQLDGGLGAIDEMVAAARRHGHDLSGHVSRQVDEALLDWADLVVTMTGQHVVDLVGLRPEVHGRTLTLREWAAAAGRGDQPDSWTPQDVRSWAAALADRPLDVLVSGSLDVDDPIGRPARFYRRTAEEIDELLTRCFGSVRRLSTDQ